jgi:hypothetical protein
MPDPDETDAQDLAEVFDEENITPDGRDIATPDRQRDVYDMTSAAEDADGALAPDDDFDPDAADEAELEQIVMAEEDLDEPRSFTRDPADLVADEALSPADLEADDVSDADLEALGYLNEDPLAAADARLDEALDETFPASDPLPVDPRAD